MPEEQTDDSEKFVEDEDETGMDIKIHLSTYEVLIFLNDEMGATVLPGLSETLVCHVNVSDAERLVGSPLWWKINEACMFSVNTFDDIVLKSAQEFSFAIT